MPLIYGEGELSARKRLENEIARREADKNRIATLQRLPAETEVAKEHVCVGCKLLPLDPVTTPCGHDMCSTCIRHLMGDTLVILPLMADGQLRGESANTNFQVTKPCRFCSSSDTPVEKFYVTADQKLLHELRPKYPAQNQKRERALKASDAEFYVEKTLVGNWHDLVGPDRHRWNVFVKPSRSDIIEDVHLQLHESFQQPHVVPGKPPYTSHGQGWGYFSIDIQLSLKPGWKWVGWGDSRNGGYPPRKDLKLEWVLDFSSYNGLGAMGVMHVAARKILGARRARLRLLFDSADRSHSLVGTRAKHYGDLEALEKLLAGRRSVHSRYCRFFALFRALLV